MRLYTFINCYLSSIQQGIQTAHILGEMCRKHRTHIQGLALDNYLQNHKTIIVCNGGNNAMIEDLIGFFNRKDNQFQIACFHEDKESLCGALTGVGILLPESIYGAEEKWTEFVDDTNYKYYEFNGEKYYQDSWEYDLVSRIKSYRLAN